MENTSIYNELEKYIEYEINRKLMIRLMDIQETIIGNYPEFEKQIKDVFQKYSYHSNILLRLIQEKKTRKKKLVPQEKRCMARTGNNTQCRRPKQNESQYCLSHQHSLPHGNINETPVKIKKIKSRSKGQYDIESLDEKLYVPGVLINIDNTYYIVDENKVIYKHGENIIVGYIDEDDNVIWF
jgi:hypothetical protein